MLELLINRRLRQNYNYVLKLENAESIKTFLSELSEREKIIALKKINSKQNIFANLLMEES